MSGSGPAPEPAPSPEGGKRRRLRGQGASHVESSPIAATIPKSGSGAPGDTGQGLVDKGLAHRCLLQKDSPAPVPAQAPVTGEASAADNGMGRRRLLQGDVPLHALAPWS